MDDQLQLFLPLALQGGDPLEWAPPVKQPRKKREANFIRLCDGCGEQIPGTGWQPGDLCSSCRIPSRHEIPAGVVCGELYRKPRCSCPPGECEVVPW